MFAATMRRAPQGMRTTAIAAGYSIAAFVRLSAKEQATLALEHIRNDADARTYRLWRRVGTAAQLAMYLPATLMLALFLSSPGIVTLLALGAVAGTEVAIQQHRLHLSRRAVAKLNHPAGKRWRR